VIQRRNSDDGMKQVIQSRRTGKLRLLDVPAPKVKAGHILVRTRASLISAGTERMVVDFARKSLAGKAKARPDLVKKVIDKAKREGLAATWRTVMARLDEPLPLGYSAAGEVVAVGAGCEGSFRVGGRVAVGGAGLANHAELNVVPHNLAHPIPDGVAEEEACYATLGAIAMHAARNAGLGLGDVAAVIGAGLVGQLAARFLTLAGARVVVLDYDQGRLDLASALGAEAALKPDDSTLINTVRTLSGGLGCDAIINAAATESSAPFELAAEIARDRARVVMVGFTGTGFPYADFMKKELEIVVSRSYGPGRYDEDYEGRGLKYPEGWVKWTEGQNMAECLRLMDPALSPRLDVTALTTHRLPIGDAEAAYDLVTGGKQPHLGVVLTYGDSDEVALKPAFAAPAKQDNRPCVVGLIGAGNYAKAVLIPGLKRHSDVRLHSIATQTGASAEHGRESFGFEHATADEQAVFDATDINAVIVATRHDSHADLAARALAAGKSVWVEKPLALDREGLNRVIEARNGTEAFFTIGFNRRFAPATERLLRHLDRIDGPRVILVRVNAGAIEGSHWVHAGDAGGGRILGETCHFIDLARALASGAVQTVSAEAAVPGEGAADDVSIRLGFADGSLATILYTAQGDTALAKERVEVFAGGAAFVIDDFRALSVVEDGSSRDHTMTQDKGQTAALQAFVGAVSVGGTAPIDEVELIETSAATVAVMESLRNGTPIAL